MRSRYPAIKGISVAEFKGQIQFVKRHYNVLTLAQCHAAIEANAPLPPNGLLLTFDDGLLDHFTVAFPILMNEGLTGAFFPPGEAIAEGKVLDVHKIHYILASVSNIEALVEEIFNYLDEIRDVDRISVAANEELWKQYAVATRLDCAEVIFVKHILQAGLPMLIRKQIIQQLFSRMVTSDEVAFASELYLTQDQMRTMFACGMEFGSHGWRHDWLNTMSEQEQVTDIDRSIEFLKSCGVWTPDWSMCYPYGRYNATTINVLKSRRCRSAFTVDVALSHVDKNDAHQIARLDTNDFPKVADALPHEWLEEQRKVNE